MELSAKNKWILVIFSAAAGFVNGFLGGGGGVIVVALLLAVAKLNQKYAQATALLIILPLTIVSACARRSRLDSYFVGHARSCGRRNSGGGRAVQT